MTNICNLNIIICLLSFALGFSQENIILPQKGIEGVSVKIDTSNISVVEKLYGKDFELIENQSFTRYTYPEIGLAFQYDTNDKNQVIRSIFLVSPFEGKLENGIQLNKTSMKEVWETYADSGCFASKTYAWHTQKGISFFIRKDATQKGYDTNEKIYKIEIHNKGEFGLPSRINFEFNKEPIERKIEEMISKLKDDNFNVAKMNDYWEAQNMNENAPYPLKRTLNFARELDFGIIQENSEIRVSGSAFELNLLKSDNKLVYLKLISQNGVLVERYSDEQIKLLLTRRELKTNVPIDIKSPIDFPMNTYVYGVFCGFIGSPPPQCEVMIELVNNNDYYDLSRWLNSMNPEIATYGYIGLDFLRRKGKDIKPIELSKMLELSTSNIQLNTCQGCLFGVTETIKEVLTEKNLKGSYSAFKQSGLLK